jgi:flavin reductase (DIM6/NTAB) family NADH-FMN oxidoreductase RutF
VERKTIAPSYANRLINHGTVVLVTCGRDPCNIITVAWITSVSSTPPLLAIAIGKTRYSRQLIDESHEFVVNVPPASLLDSVWKCGTISGRDADKFRAAGLTKVESEGVSPPLIAECIAWLECRVTQTIEVGDHLLYIGQPLVVSVRPDAFNDVYTLCRPHETLHHLGGDCFTISSGIVRPKKGE